MLDALPDQVSIYEVSPRDGLQNEALPIPLEGKKQLILALIEAGLKRIELTSFVLRVGCRSWPTPKSSRANSGRRRA